MIKLEFNVVKNYLRRTDFNILAAPSRNSVNAKFTFSSDWSNISPIVVEFTKSGNSFDVKLEDGECTIPWEVLESSGILEIAVAGGDLITTNVVRINVYGSGIVGGLAPTMASPGVYGEIAALAEEIEKGYSNIKDIMNTYEETVANSENNINTTISNAKTDIANIVAYADTSAANAATSAAEAKAAAETFVTDTTLSIDGRPADAATTGEQITNLKDDKVDKGGLDQITANNAEFIAKTYSANYFDPTCASVGGYLNSGGVVINDSPYGYSDNITVEADEVIFARYSANLIIYPGIYVLKDGTIGNIKSLSDYTYVNDNTNNIRYWTATMPENVAYIKVNFLVSALSTWAVYRGLEEWPDTFIEYSVKKTLSEDILLPTIYSSKLYGKKIIFCGDSITYGAYADTDETTGEKKNYAYYIKKATGADISLDAISGSTITNYEGKNPFSVDRYKALGDNLDYIILAFSTNDSALGDTYSDYLGTISDAENTTFYGAWNVVLQYLIATYPAAKIGIIGFWRGNQRYQYTDALREICHKYMIPMLDFMFDANIPMVGGTDFRSYNPNAPFTVDYNTLVARKNAFLVDTVHPNDVGHQYLATIIQSYIERL